MKLLNLILFFLTINLQFGIAANDSAFISKKSWKENIKKYDYNENFKEIKNKESKSNNSFFANLAKSRRITIFIVIIILIVVLIFLILGVYKDFKLRIKNKTDKGSAVIENIETADLDNLLLAAIDNRLYKEAIRYKYLILLRDLNAKKLISWKKDKTNGQYIREMIRSAGFDLFRVITIKFEYFWYGEYSVEEADYSNIVPLFEKMEKLIYGRE